MSCSRAPDPSCLPQKLQHGNNAKYTAAAVPRKVFQLTNVATFHCSPAPSHFPHLIHTHSFLLELFEQMQF